MSCRQDSDVGITSYLNPHEGFGGIVKMRFQDFLVNEIDENDQVVHLTDVTCNLPKNEVKVEPENTNKEEIVDILSDEGKEKLLSLVDNKEIEHVFLKGGASKDERAKIHQAIRYLHPQLESRTVDDSDKNEKVIKVTRATENSRGQNKKRLYPRKQLCKFVLFKRNIGTMSAISQMAKCLHLHKANGFQYAGTKDKRAVTAQLVTAPVAPERLRGLNKLKTNIKVGNFSYCSKPLQLGSLRGNHFTIVIRNITGSEKDIATAFESFTTNGFINYFGLQRFGTTSVPTHVVGIAILKSKWQEVVNLLLQPRDDETDINLNRALKEYLESGDVDAALKCLKYKSSIEGILLQGLKRFGKTQLLQAITTIPRNMRKMYVHAYQSYIWNQVASKRVKELGFKPLAGDIVLADVYENRISSNGDKDEPPVKKLRSERVSVEDDVNSIKCSSEDIKFLTEKDLELFKIEDVLLPLPGHDVKYPENVVKNWYQEIMLKDDINIDIHMVHKVKDYSLPGAYRNIVTLPSRVEYDTIRYDDYTVPLLQTDLEKLNDIEETTNVPDGKFLAMRLQFSLPSSCYATVALRELMKTDLSLSAQKKLNDDHGSVEVETKND
uniref:pseudouridylate synthase 7 homolog n=1 Tax=Styela clava TaxID=7725 RepID=UPI00193A9761|nr:pseudouridylate synthase 7 homolog [Styela clava]